MYRFTFSFSLYGQGWSETLFRASLFDPGSIAQLDNYMQKRLNLMCTDAILLSVRASNVDTARDVTIYHDPTVVRTGTWALGGLGTTESPGTPTNAEDTFTALLTRLSNGGTAFRSFSLVAMPDYVLQGNAIFPAERPVLVGRLNSWIGAMSGAAFGMKAQGAPTASGRIVEFYPKTLTNQLVTLGIDGGVLAAGDHVILGNVKGFPKLNRTWKVAKFYPATVDDPAYIDLAGSAALNTYGPVQGGTWKKASYGVTALSQYTISRLTAKKTGVPFGTVRGRR